jgi:prepilin-type N-terminal cleavage/methylation domain-containing protein
VTWLSTRRESERSNDHGFTLIELLVVLVVLPLIIFAVAEAVIVSLESEGATTGRLSDSVNAQLTSAYFVRDVQGASALTTDPTPQSSYSATSPQICGPSPVSGSDHLLVGLYHPPANGVPALDVGYWQQGASAQTVIDRYSCILTGQFTVSSVNLVTIASSPPGTTTGNSTSALSVTTDISPSQFAQAASAGWTPASAYTEVFAPAAPALSPAVDVEVASLAGFDTTSLPITVTAVTTGGPQTITCGGTGTFTSLTEGNLPELTGCTAAHSLALGTGALVTQANVSAVQISVTEPASGYKYSLLGMPRSGTADITNGVGPGATLVALGADGIALNGVGSNHCGYDPNNGKEKVCVSGDIVVDGGDVSCNLIYATGHLYTAGSSTCSSGSSTSASLAPDPMTGLLPSCFQNPAQLNTYSSLQINPVNGYIKPGIYTTQLQGQLEPGVYVAEGGVGDVTMAAYSANDSFFQENASSTADPDSGVLIYLPGAYGSYSTSSGCTTEPSGTPPSGLGGSVALAPLDSSQSSYYFGGNPGLAGMWVWQDATNPTPWYLTGNANICTGNAYGSGTAAFQSQCGSSQLDATPSAIYGVAYLPAADVALKGNPGIYTGRLIVAGYNPGAGTPAIDLSGSSSGS